ncbi:MAG TPA: tetratricopeptide repeat protein [Smithellaceae bacterium]|nr:tetratricopeptide repeat protein [Smithellaceae bacterium]
MVKQEATANINLKMKKVLVVDDFFNFRLTMKNMLRSLGIMYIDDAANGEEAIKKLAARKFDIILCDYNLGPGKSGQQVLEEAKYRGYINYAGIFIMVTAENTLEMIMGAMEYEPDDYLMKPFAKEVLEKKIKSVTLKKENVRDIEKAIIDSDFDHALRICDELIAQSPANLAEIMKLKGEVLLKKGAYAEAAEFYDKVLTMGNMTWARLGRGRADLLLGRYEDAKNRFEEILAQNNKVIAAYDELARTYLKSGQPEEAQQVLMKAAAISPRALLRHKILGGLAYRNEDYTTAETSFRAAVVHGKHSCFKTTSDYTQLAKSMVMRDALQESLQVLGQASREFPESPDTRLHLSAAESLVYTKMNKPAEAKRALAQAHKYAQDLAGDLPSAVALDLAQAHLLAGDVEKGTDIIRGVIGANHDNDDVLNIIRIVFKETGMPEKGEKIIKDTTEDIMRLNNEGVDLARRGKLAEAIDYFEKAAARLPENKIINANAAQVLMLFMKQNGPDEERLSKASSYLERVRRIDGAYADIPMLLSMYRELASREVSS